MFTGLIEEIGTIVSITTDVKTQQVIIVVHAHVVLKGVKLGDSIAVNGVCLTVTHFSHSKHTLTFGLSPETLKRSNLGTLMTPEMAKKADMDAKIGKDGPSHMRFTRVNLERSMAADGRVGGHFVQGHVDGMAKIISFRHEKDMLVVTLQPIESEWMRYIVEKGYITIDGTSLTVINVTSTTFSIMLVQYTQSKIILPIKQVGDMVNLEVDVMGKYIGSYLNKLLGTESTLTEESKLTAAHKLIAMSKL